mgnify:CR=1 FL=1
MATPSFQCNLERQLEFHLITILTHVSVAYYFSVSFIIFELAPFLWLWDFFLMAPSLAQCFKMHLSSIKTCQLGMCPKFWIWNSCLKVPPPSPRSGAPMIGKVEFPTLISLGVPEKLSVAPPANFTIQQQRTVIHVGLDNTTTWLTWPTNSRYPVTFAHAIHLHPLKVFLGAVIVNQNNTATHRPNYVQRAQVGTKCSTKQPVLKQSVPNANPVNFKMNPGLKRAKIARLDITKARKAYRIAWGAFLGSTKI